MRERQHGFWMVGINENRKKVLQLIISTVEFSPDKSCSVLGSQQATDNKMKWVNTMYWGIEVGYDLTAS